MLVKIPSKLYLSGEYSVLYPNATAIIIPIDKYTYMDIQKSNEDEIISDIEDKNGYISTAKEIVMKYLDKNDKFTMKYTTELYLENKKMGLGSSASIIAVTIKGILKYYNQYSKELLFKLSVLTLLKKKSKGSMGDIACICYNTPILYSHSNISGLEFNIKAINIHKDILIKAIWTETPISTDKQIKDVDSLFGKKDFISFKNNSNILNNILLFGLENADDRAIYTSIRGHRDNLRNFEKISNIKIYNDEINDIIKNNKNAKTSGAGLGDFIISIERDFNEQENGTYRVKFETKEGRELIF